jgi:hypothetical protein
MTVMPLKSAPVLCILAAMLQPASAHEPVLADPLDPYAPVTRTHYHAILNHYQASPILNRPLNWRELNDRAEQIGGPLGQLREVNEPIRKHKKN